MTFLSAARQTMAFLVISLMSVFASSLTIAAPKASKPKPGAVSCSGKDMLTEFAATDPELYRQVPRRRREKYQFRSNFLAGFKTWHRTIVPVRHGAPDGSTRHRSPRQSQNCA